MKKSIKKSLLLFTSLLLITFTACAKSKSAGKKEAVKQAETAVTVNPEIEKLNRVLLSMSPRCKEAIPNGDPEEFLADLKRVLETRSDFSR